ncbi:large-conductance mechanosensitive channel protein MscL [Patescibacteria group bacterium]|nr:large-conductance mechanosensitive channel protein MscL [Patescibacteria group bacterium]
MNAFITEFKAFAVRGNVVDLAIAVIIGTAFGKIVSSLVDTVIMPFLSIFLGGVNFSTLSLTVGAVVVQYGLFLQSIVDFLIIALVIFVAVKGISRLKRAEERIVEDAKEIISHEARLLGEIRDLIRDKR